MKRYSDKLIYSPSDLIRFLSSPFASWMDRYYLENPGAVVPDQETEDQKLIAETGNRHELAVLSEFNSSVPGLVEIPSGNIVDAREKTLTAVKAKAPIIYQAALEGDQFAGFADFIILDAADQYQVWDTKLARSPKPYYAVQLCCYSEMFASATGSAMPEKFGIILGTKDRVEFRVEDFIHYYRHIRNSFIAMQTGFTGNMDDRPEPLPRADHGRWTSYAEEFFEERGHLARVAGISVGQIKKLNAAGITTAAELAAASGRSVRKLAADSLEKLVAQARLQSQTIADRLKDPEAPARYEVLAPENDYEPVGLAALPPNHPADVFFDMEGYPLMAGGLEYLFGATTINKVTKAFEFTDWWAHDRDEEKIAFEGFIDWAFERWRTNPGMHVYHYAAYEVSAVRRLSTRHNTRQDEVDELLRHEVFVDLYKIVRQGLRIGENSYSIKKVELFYRPKRGTDVANATDSIVQYARWMESEEPPTWKESEILKGIRDYNKDDCDSTAELLQWLRKIAADNGIAPSNGVKASASAAGYEPKELPSEVIARLEVAKKLAERNDETSTVLADVVDFHRREQKPIWWKMFDRAAAPPEVLRDDNGCIADVKAVGETVPEKRSLLQSYRFDPAQECKLAAGEKSTVMFTHELSAKPNLFELNSSEGTLTLKATQKTLDEKFGGGFPMYGSLIPYEHVGTEAIQKALTEIAEMHLEDKLPSAASALVARVAPQTSLQKPEESTIDAAIRVAKGMSGGCLVIQGPPGTGKTYTASHVIKALVAEGKKVGIASNSHKAINNLLTACGDVMRQDEKTLIGVKAGGEKEGDLFSDNPAFQHVSDNGKAFDAFSQGVIGGTAWLFTRPEWASQLDFLFIDEAGQVSLANVIAVSRCAQNLVMLGDQMQLEQPIQGSHPGDSGLSGLQYALKDLEISKPDLPEFHAVVPPDYGLFLGQSRRMHPDVCSFISESIYEGRLDSHPDCGLQRIEVPPEGAGLVPKENGIVFVGVEHDGNIQQSIEEVEKVNTIYKELLGRPYTSSDGKTRPLGLSDFLFIAPYNAQVRALNSGLPDGARVGSVDKFQGQEAPVCILSLCSSYGEYGSRGLGFILDRNRINVAISRAQCLAIVVADPRIAGTAAGSLEEMKLINLFCKLTTLSDLRH